MRYFQQNGSGYEKPNLGEEKAEKSSEQAYKKVVGNTSPSSPCLGVHGAEVAVCFGPHLPISSNLLNTGKRISTIATEASKNMNPEIDYYARLGALPSAEDIIIRAAYRGLAQRYHPDRNGNAEAKARMQEINEAYEILSDPQKRKAYDDLRKQRKGYAEYSAEDEQQESAFDHATAELEEHWKIAAEYYPDLDQLNGELRQTSYTLAFAFKTTLLETKKFEERHQIAKELIENFLRTYFGSNPKVIAFAKELIRRKAREATMSRNLLNG